MVIHLYVLEKTTKKRERKESLFEKGRKMNCEFTM